jgi:hypothetical protein
MLNYLNFEQTKLILFQVERAHKGERTSGKSSMKAIASTQYYKTGLTENLHGATNVRFYSVVCC